MPADSPVFWYVVDAEPVFATKTDHPPPTGDSRSILYPVIGEPPLLAGAVHERLICDDDTIAALNAVGVSGTVDDVLAAAAVDADPIPIAFIADTL